MSCQRTVSCLDAFVDGELPPARMIDVEQHLIECEMCLERVRLIEALRQSMRRAVHQQTIASDAFRARLTATIAAERLREGLVLEGEASRFPLSWGMIAPMAAAAMLTLAFAGWYNAREASAPSASVNSQPASPSIAPMSVEQLLDELVDYHASPPAPQITQAELVPDLEPQVGVPVHVPELEQYGASWEGGGVIPVRNQRAAVFRYRLSNHPVTIYVYNSRRVPLRGALEPRVVRNTAVHVGERRGYSIAAMEQRGIGYAVATDLNDNESAELVASLH